MNGVARLDESPYDNPPACVELASHMAAGCRCIAMDRREDVILSIIGTDRLDANVPAVSAAEVLTKLPACLSHGTVIEGGIL